LTCCQRSQVACKSPSCIFFPRDSDDVAAVVQLLRNSTDLFAVRSGGHSPLSEWANVNDGVLISMRDIKELTFDANKSEVRSGSGNRWGEIYEFLEPSKRLIVGGRSPTVGFRLLGGLSHLSNEFGLVSSIVIALDVVPVNGTKVVVSESSNPDLFWAFRGGGSNYGTLLEMRESTNLTLLGIVTHPTFRTVPMGQVWGGSIIYSGNKRDFVMAHLMQATFGNVSAKLRRSAQSLNVGA
ncbi:FAD-binding domain-containing protein, partial [Bimuria novae-zelandiae CBS 107.79]